MIHMIYMIKETHRDTGGKVHMKRQPGGQSRKGILILYPENSRQINVTYPPFRPTREPDMG